MRIETARLVKAELREQFREMFAEPLVAGPAATVAVGICPSRGEGYGVAIRHSGAPLIAQALTERARRLAGADCDIRDIGSVRALSWAPGQLRGRVRPLRPGLSVAHSRATAGTIGAFARPTAADQPICVLSNNHVVADSNRGRPGDIVLQPGPSDGGLPADDRIGVLDRMVAMRPDAANLVDAATVVLDDGVEIDDAYPAGPLTGWADADVGLGVEKVGRTTGLTRGQVTAIELDGLAVLYPIGLITFDGQVEVAGDGSVPFSAGGDSGSLGYDPAAAEAIGLLFAGSERGGPDGYGLTYCNPIGAVLDALDLRLGLQPEVAGEDGRSARGARVAKQELAAQLAGDPRVSGVGITRWHGRYALRVNVVDETDAPALPAQFRGIAVQVVAVGRVTSLPQQ